MGGRDSGVEPRLWVNGENAPAPGPTVTPLFVAVVLSVASALAYAGAAVLQERVAARQRDPVAGVAVPAFRFLSVIRWWVSVGCNGAGAALHVAALAYGPLSVVQPLGALTLVLALPLGAAAIGRWATARQWSGAAVTVAGLAVFLSLTTPGASTEGLDNDDATLVAVAAILLILGVGLGARWSRRPMARALLVATAAGVAFAVASALTQTVVRDVLERGAGAFASPLTAALVGMAVAGVLLSQFAYRDGGLGAPLAAVTLANPVASMVIATVVLGERSSGGLWGAIAATAGGAAAAWGVWLLAVPARPEPSAGADARPPAPAEHSPVADTPPPASAGHSAVAGPPLTGEPAEPGCRPGDAVRG